MPLLRSHKKQPYLSLGKAQRVVLEGGQSSGSGPGPGCRPPGTSKTNRGHGEPVCPGWGPLCLWDLRLEDDLVPSLPPPSADSLGTPARRRRSCGGRGVPLPALASVRAAAAARLGWRGRSRAGAAQQVPRLPPPRRGEKGRAGAGGGGRFGEPRARPAPQAGCELAASGSAPSPWWISQPAAAGDPGTTRSGVRRAASRDKGAGPARRRLLLFSSRLAAAESFGARRAPGPWCG